ncbi:XdhC/CoxI family protein [Desulfobaculum senezii]
MKKLVHSIRQQLESGHDLVLATIVDHDGSTPRSSGSKMAIHRDGCIDGSVGGGIVEALVQRAAADLFTAGEGAASFQDFDLSNELAANADMICGGHVRVMLEHLPATSWASAAYATLDDRLRHGQKTVLLTLLQDGPSPRVSSRAVLTANQPVPAWSGLQPEDAKSLCATALSSGKPLIHTMDGARLVAESFSPMPSLFIYGAGHVSRPTAQLASMVDFRTIVLDDRPEFASDLRFPHADELRILSDFDTALTGADVDEDAYIVIVTRGHIHDKTVLAQALRTPARYIGMIGSTRKRNAIYDALLADGFTQQDIDRCHSPIGLSIGAQTPEEIAVSIVAELIAIRSGALA